MNKKIALIGLLFLGASGAIYYYWSQATALPQWYTKEEASTEQALKIEDGVSSKSSKVEEKVGEIELDQQALNERKRLLLNATNGINTVIKDDKVEIGTVVDTSEIPVASLNSTEEALLNQAIKSFPVLKDREVYIGIEGNVAGENGRLQLDDNTKVKVGNVSMKITDVSRMLGVPPEIAKQQLELQLERLNISNVELENSKN